jgi:sec-independent protein translocase protein TatA
MPHIGFWELGLIVLVIGLLFGGKKIPELMKGIGAGMKEFKKAASPDDNQPNKLNDINKQ